MAEKIKVTNISSVGIILRRRDPTQLFLEVKDDGHPINLVRRQLCPIGGNWIGDAAKADRNTLETFRRELQEELSFDRPIRSSIELALLGQADIEEFAPTPDPAASPRKRDIAALAHLKRVICESALSGNDYIITIPKAVLDAADSENKRDGFTTLCSYWTIALEEKEWTMLVKLQEKFKNLSNESITLITSLDEIVQTGTNTAFGHDQKLQRFFLNASELWGPEYATAKDFPIVPGIESIYASPSLSSYEEYLERYDVARKP